MADQAGREATPRCAVCQDRIEYLDPTGDGLSSWWAHEHHPADNHDAVPARVAKDRGGLWRGFCACGWYSPLLTKTKATTARKQHRVAVHPLSSVAREQ